MIKKTITWKDFKGNMQTRDFYFHMMKPELADWANNKTNGHILSLEELISQIIKTNDSLELTELFKEIIDLSYGILSLDGMEFTKSPEILHKFKSTGAYEALYMELISDAKIAAAFIEGILPEDLVEAARKQISEENAETPEEITEPAPAQQTKADPNQLGV